VTAAWRFVQGSKKSPFRITKSTVADTSPLGTRMMSTLISQPHNTNPPLLEAFTLCEAERWYAVHTLPLNEARAEYHLANQSFSTFMPKRLKTVRHARKSITVEAPFFPRYIFIVLDLNRDPWRKVNSTCGVSRLVMCADEPQAVPHGIVEALIASTGDRGILQLEEKLKVGGVVRLMAGPFADQLGRLEHLDDSGRVQVLLDLLGRQVRATTTATNVLPVT
jgi:transcription elongation factor/antiterminator RfaH